MKILYGNNSTYIDVTNICLTHSHLFYNDTIRIPSDDDKRAFYFTDPLIGVKKNVMIITDDTNIPTDDTNITNVLFFDDTYIIDIDCTNKVIEAFRLVDKINYLHSMLTLKHGDFLGEYPEQCMIVRFLRGCENVLEIGSNIGRTSMLIASIIFLCREFCFVQKTIKTTWMGYV